MVSSFLLYSFLYCLREYLRLLTGDLGSQWLLVLSPQENFTYNFITALISSGMGMAVSFRYFSQHVKTDSKRTKYLLRRAATNQAFYSIFFFYWLVKVSFLLGILYLTFTFEFDINFLEDFLLLFWLMPLVLFLNLWIDWLKYFGRRMYKGLLWSMLGILVYSLLLAQFNYYDYQSFNENKLKANLVRSKNLILPEAEYDAQYVIKNRRLVEELYMFYSVNPRERRKVYLKDYKNSFRELLSDHELYVELSPENVYEHKRIILHLDARLNMEEANTLIRKLRNTEMRQTIFNIAPISKQYPNNYTEFRNKGIPISAGYYDPTLTELLDSIEELDLKKYRIKLNPSDFFVRNYWVRSANRIKVNIDKDGELTLNYNRIGANKLEREVGFYIQQNKEYLIVFEYDRSISFQDYINVRTLFNRAIAKQRNDRALFLFGKEYYSNDFWGEEKRIVEKEFPMFILEWTDQELRIEKLLEKQERIRGKF